MSVYVHAPDGGRNRSASKTVTSPLTARTSLAATILCGLYSSPTPGETLRFQPVTGISRG